MNRSRLEQMLQRHEGFRLKPYLDTVGKLTIGVGRNLTDVGISSTEALDFLSSDIDSAVRSLTATLPWFTKLDDVRQEVLVDMCFNMGIVALTSRNPAMLKAAEVGDFATAAREMLDGPWKDQVKGRAYELADMMRDGVVSE